MGIELLIGILLVAILLFLIILPSGVQYVCDKGSDKGSNKSSHKNGYHFGLYLMLLLVFAYSFSEIVELWQNASVAIVGTDRTVHNSVASRMVACPGLRNV
jgi:hypothetical protein